MEYKDKMEKPGINDTLKNSINTVRHPLIILDESLKVVLANHSFYQVFKVKPGETEGRFICRLIVRN